ncbi:MAG: glycosyltransferase [Chloroflexota bacterium]|nr:glycosyltransferase [Chloroflexota bacterium]
MTASPRITYVIGTYPQLTTTFIDREISALVKRGVDVRIVSMRRPATPPSGDQSMLAQRTEYILPPQPLRMGMAQVRWLVRRPMTYLRTLAFLLTRPHEHGSRLRTAAHFLMGVEVADRLRDRADGRLHAHFADRAATVALVAGRLLGIGYSLTAHANDIYLQPTLLPTKIGQSRVTITCTEHNLQYLRERTRPAAREKLRRIYHGLELERYVNLERTPAQPATVVSVGQLKEKKGLRDLVDAIAVLRDGGMDVRCRIIGDGPLRSELTERIERHRLSERVDLTGALPHDAVIAHYREATIFALPCVVAGDGDRDGIPNAILEAMASAIPVVSTPVSGIPEVVEHEATGLLTPPADAQGLADALRRLLLDEELRERLGREARARVVDAFDVDRNAVRFLEAIDGPI